MSNTILFVFEGEKIEGQVCDSIEKIFFTNPNGQQIIRSSYKAEIYQLWNEIKDDADLDIVEVLKQKSDSDIKNMARKDVSEIHLFFDHDGHSHSDIISQKISLQDYDQYYFGEKYFNECKNEMFTKNCSFFCYQNI